MYWCIGVLVYWCIGLGFVVCAASAQASALREQLLERRNALLFAGSGSESGAGEDESSATTVDVVEDNYDEKTGGEGAVDPVGALSESAPADIAQPIDGVDESKSAKIIALLEEKLPECTSKQKADEFCASFCYVSTKNSRRRLVQALLHIPRSRHELIAPYARIAASLAQLHNTDIVPPLLDALQREFHGMLRTRNQLYVENKLKCVRLLGELVKFRVAPPIVAFRMFKALLADFSAVSCFHIRYRWIYDLPGLC